MSACVGWFGRVFGHRFAARYSTSEKSSGRELKLSDWASAWMLSGDLRDALVAASRPLEERIYCGDICTRCGSIVNRAGSEGGTDA